MSQRDVPEWMPLYVYEFLADRNVQAMSLDELGAYFLLIMTQWVNGSVPSDMRVLARLLRNQDPEMMERIWQALAPCYREHPTMPGELIQGRVEEERETARQRLAGNSRGGRTSAERRRGRVAVDPEPEVERIETHPNTEEGWDVEQAFGELWEAYPAKGRVRRIEAQHAFVDHIRSREVWRRAMDAVRGKFARSEKWAKGFVMALPSWIAQECWDEDPEPAEARQETQSTMDPETRRRIKERRGE